MSHSILIQLCPLTQYTQYYCFLFTIITVKAIYNGLIHDYNYRYPERLHTHVQNHLQTQTVSLGKLSCSDEASAEDFGAGSGSGAGTGLGGGEGAIQKTG